MCFGCALYEMCCAATGIGDVHVAMCRDRANSLGSEKSCNPNGSEDGPRWLSGSMILPSRVLIGLSSDASALEDSRSIGGQTQDWIYQIRLPFGLVCGRNSSPRAHFELLHARCIAWVFLTSRAAPPLIVGTIWSIASDPPERGIASGLIRRPHSAQSQPPAGALSMYHCRIAFHAAVLRCSALLLMSSPLFVRIHRGAVVNK